MPLVKFANAAVTNPQFSPEGWRQVRTAAKRNGNVSVDLVEQASGVFDKPFNPTDYLLTHCFPAGHQVLMADGTERSIELVRVDDLVVTHRGNIRPVTRVMQREVAEDLTVFQAASLPEVTCTGEHPFYIIPQVQAWCRVYPSYQGEVKCTFGGKQVCEQNYCSTNGAVPTWREARDIQAGDRTYTPTLHETRIPQDLNPNRMRLLGYYVAEGRVDKDAKGRPYSIRFALHDDELKTLGKEISCLMKLEFGIQSHSVIKNKKRAAAEGDLGVIIAFHSHKHAPWFLEHAGIGSRTKRLSLDVVLAPVAWQKQLMGAWINGDGCNDANSRGSSWSGIRLSTTSDDLASQAVVILDRVGVYSRLQATHTPERQIRGRTVVASDGWHVSIPRSYVMGLQGVVKWDLTGPPCKRLSTKRRYRYVASVLSEVESTSTRFFRGIVYNLSVAEDESYVVNRQAAHNCTIIASVDVYQPSGLKTGRLLEDGFQVNRKYPKFRVTQETKKYINNNLDFWPREVLAKSYKTFIGAHSFIEHVQIEDLSKGRIIDAVLRDIGQSYYVDILVANDRKHVDLIRAIENGKMSTLSMGCTIDGSQCSQCGHWAADESEMCSHIRYSKGNTFYDEMGRPHIVAEKCGDESLDPTGGVQFIEGSWVGTPAFTGAVTRNILDPSVAISRRAQEILSMPPAKWDADSQRKAASTAYPGSDMVMSQWDEDEEEEGDDDGGSGEEETPLKQLEDELAQHMRDRVRKRIRQDMQQEDLENALSPEDSSMAPNDGIIKEAGRVYKASLGALVRTASSDAHLLEGVATLNQSLGIAVPVQVYRSVLAAGVYDSHNPRAFLRACHRALGRRPSKAEVRTMIRLGKLISRRGVATTSSLSSQGEETASQPGKARRSKR